MSDHQFSSRRTWLFAVALLLAAAGPVRALNVAVPYVRADFMWAQGFDGSGVEVGVIDLFQADSSHPAISPNHLGSENFVKGAGWVGPHATQVIGAAVSQHSTFTGAAPQAGWWTAQTTNRGTITKVRKQTIAAETFGQGLRGLAGNPVEVLTLSIGLGGNSSGADQWSLALDHIVHSNGRTITVAAGNDGPTSGSVSGLPSGAYNVIIVGATGDTDGSPSEDYTRVAGYSSRGPTSNGRSKPDIVAPGSVIHMPTTRGGWTDSSGTSFATPIVAGGAALLIDMGQTLGYSTDPKVIKSVLLNSADKLAGWSNTLTRPLDPNQGAGQMNLQRAHRQYTPGEHGPGPVPGVGWDRGVVTGSAENVYLFDLPAAAGEILTATLAWDRVVTTNTEDVESAIYRFDHLDDLNLFLYRADDLTVPIASSVSSIDNVEHLYFPVPDPGRYALGVMITGAGAGDAETYGLAWDLLTERIPGDANDNGFVDDTDLAILLGNWESDELIISTWELGNFTEVTLGDTDADDSDLAVLLGNWTGPPPPAGAAVPEPATLALLALGGLSVVRRRRRS